MVPTRWKANFADQRSEVDRAPTSNKTTWMNAMKTPLPDDDAVVGFAYGTRMCTGLASLILQVRGAAMPEGGAVIRFSVSHRWRDILQSRTDHLPEFGGVRMTVLGHGVRHRCVEDLILGTRDSERAVDVIRYLAAVDHLPSHVGPFLVAPAIGPAMSLYLA